MVLKQQHEKKNQTKRFQDKALNNKPINDKPIKHHPDETKPSGSATTPHPSIHTGLDDSAPFQTFVVNESGLSLRVLSEVVYGSKDDWEEIAQWNQLKAPYPLFVGQRLKLKLAEPLSRSEFNRRLLQIWKAKLHAEDATIRFSDAVSKVTLDKKTGRYMIRFKKMTRTYRLKKNSPLAECILNSLKNRTPVEISATHTEHEIARCR